MSVYINSLLLMGQAFYRVLVGLRTCHVQLSCSNNTCSLCFHFSLFLPFLSIETPSLSIPLILVSSFQFDFRLLISREQLSFTAKTYPYFGDAPWWAVNHRGNFTALRRWFPMCLHVHCLFSFAEPFLRRLLITYATYSLLICDTLHKYDRIMMFMKRWWRHK